LTFTDEYSIGMVGWWVERQFYERDENQFKTPFALMNRQVDCLYSTLFFFYNSNSSWNLKMRGKESATRFQSENPKKGGKL